jgi:hypothetical protein
LYAIVYGVGALWDVEAEFSFPLFGVEPVAGKAVVGKNGTDFPVEIHLALRSVCRKEGEKKQEGRKEGDGAHRRGILSSELARSEQVQ